MSIESDLRKDGIEVISKLDTLRINSIARSHSRNYRRDTAKKLHEML